LPQHVQAADEILVVPIIESVRGAQNAASLAAVPGADIFFFGPADLSATAGAAGQWEGHGVADLIAQATRSLAAAGKHFGVVTRDNDDMAQRHAQGFRMLGLGLDGSLLVGALRQRLAGVNRDRPIHVTLSPENDPAAYANEKPAACAPASMRPDRSESMAEPNAGPQIQLAPGVNFDCMVGAHNGARSLTTGTVSFAPGASLPCHRHTFSETLTLLEGSAVIEVEGRRYTLEPWDNLTIPKGLAHAAYNLDEHRTARLHVAMPTDDPARVMVDAFYSKRAMPHRSHHDPAGERFTVLHEAKRYEPGPNASFIDLFNADLLPGLEMSGGYAEFTKGGRLPAHLHDFDESIYIHRGSATCVVEGRKYQMTPGSTALQPRGRIHYFINHAPDTMIMLWTYAGSHPERLVVDDRCADVGGVAWA
jgi:quercetin dioxygenase-like cupin family protein